ncbi:MAG TPA: M20/M25/M40 family metallo-hydrolase [Thermoanaerobaculia bacterium]|nr:M20/M25/M40 family metallo-hydrolase [Thermoanaerobaculia bacterium]
MPPQIIRPLLIVSVAIVLTACATVAPKTQPNLTQSPRVRALLESPKVLAAFADIDSRREQTIQEWRDLTEINAPSGQETARASAVETTLRGLRLDSVSRDSVGNLIALRKGSGGGPRVVIDSHLDTVFQPGLEIKTTIKDGRLYAPGVGDDTRNIAAMLSMLRAMNAADIRTKGDLVFLFTVEEETSFRGIDQYLADNKGTIDHLIALDGGYEGFTYGGIGTNWYKHHFIGPGGHTRSSTPPWSATLPVARSILRISKLKVPDSPPSWLNVGMLGGSDVVNAKAADAWFSLDLRSTDNEVILDLERKIAAILNDEAQKSGMTLKTEVISSEKPAQIAGHRQSLLVHTTEAVYDALGFIDPSITPTASNHSSAALRAGISAIATGTAPCRGAHSVTENCEIEPIFKGIRKILLLSIAMTGVDGL